MTIDHPIRRALARICSGETLSRVVDPILADIRWERGRPAWRGYRDLTAALLLHSVTSAPGVMSSIWSDDRRAMPKAALLCGVVALVSMVLLALPPLSQLDVPIGPGLLFLAPQFLMLTLPAALLAAIPIALSGVAVQMRVVRRTLALALCLMGLTLVLAWTFPTTNQAFRVLTAGQPVAPGANELGFTHLRGRIRELGQMRGGDAAAKRLEFSYQNRVALVCAPIPFALLALGLAASRAGRRRPIATGVSATFLYFFAMMPITSLTAWLLLRGSDVPPILIAWMPNAVMLTFAALFYQNTTFSPQNKSSATPPIP